ncbi:hypothetical protein BPT24_065 [Tenacibaculum phage pT24]|uniref:Uncharacterized protein n=1 Tax=Tenacibaculum phage pT24 TaxID=1880590 RepID=A0A1B4XWJ4_9CAUD|nr:hypothetical protein HYP10_gp065 [Tenacibaculum phage pT24]BAV39188.1 hypothetical protein BPT24_065 [Tenacibaculum phage pT24]
MVVKKYLDGSKLEHKDFNINNNERVESTVIITRVFDGKTKTIEHDMSCFLNDGGVSTYQWSDGNYACDCNRSIFFGEDVPEDIMEIECTDGKYKVELINPNNNKSFYKE